MKIGDTIEFRGPSGLLVYQGKGDALGLPRPAGAVDVGAGPAAAAWKGDPVEQATSSLGPVPQLLESRWSVQGLQTSLGGHFLPTD